MLVVVTVTDATERRAMKRSHHHYVGRFGLPPCRRDPGARILQELPRPKFGGMSRCFGSCLLIFATCNVNRCIHVLSRFQSSRNQAAAAIIHRFFQILLAIHVDALLIDTQMTGGCNNSKPILPKSNGHSDKPVAGLGFVPGRLKKCSRICSCQSHKEPNEPCAFNMTGPTNSI